MADRPHKTPVEKEIRKAVQSGNYAIDTTKEELREMNPDMVQWRLDRLGIENLSPEAQSHIRGQGKDVNKEVPQEKVKSRHQVRAHADNIDYRKNKDIKELQKNLNEYLGPEGVNAYSKKHSLRVDGIFGPRTQFRLQKFKDLYEHITQDSVFNAIKNQREQWEIDTWKHLRKGR